MKNDKTLTLEEVCKVVKDRCFIIDVNYAFARLECERRKTTFNAIIASFVAYYIGFMMLKIIPVSALSIGIGICILLSLFIFKNIIIKEYDKYLENAYTKMKISIADQYIGKLEGFDKLSDDEKKEAFSKIAPSAGLEKNE